MYEKIDSRGKVGYIDRLVSRRLRIRRMMLGITQEELANIVNVSVQQIQKYEKAFNRISSGKLYIFAKFLRVSINYFFQEVEKNNEFSCGVILGEENFDQSLIESQFHVTEKEIATLINLFSKINPQMRKQIIDILTVMASASDLSKEE